MKPDAPIQPRGECLGLPYFRTKSGSGPRCLCLWLPLPGPSMLEALKQQGPDQDVPSGVPHLPPEPWAVFRPTRIPPDGLDPGFLLACVSRPRP